MILFSSRKGFILFWKMNHLGSASVSHRPLISTGKSGVHRDPRLLHHGPASLSAVLSGRGRLPCRPPGPLSLESRGSGLSGGLRGGHVLGLGSLSTAPCPLGPGEGPWVGLTLPAQWTGAERQRRGDSLEAAGPRACWEPSPALLPRRPFRGDGQPRPVLWKPVTYLVPQFRMGICLGGDTRVSPSLMEVTSEHDVGLGLLGWMNVSARETQQGTGARVGVTD